VWDPLVRIGHWSLVATIACAWATREGSHRWHEIFGYAAIGIVAMRVLWGFFGLHYARFSQFVRAPSVTLCYAKHVLAADEPRYVGHNPLGGWMIVLVLFNILLLALSGWLFTTDTYWGVEWVEELHAGLCYALFVLIALHVSGVALASFRHHENLVAAMLHGRKRAATDTAESENVRLG